MKDYYVVVMSIDPDEDPDDNHQKYGIEVEAESESEAVKKASAEIAGRGLPVYWAKVA
jgi:hypothetical protein